MNTQENQTDLLNAPQAAREFDAENRYLARTEAAAVQYALEAERRRIAQAGGQKEYVPMGEGEFLTGLKAPAEPPPAQQTQKTVPQKAWGVYKDIFTGYTELPRAAANGLSKAVTEAADLAYQAGSMFLKLPDAALGTHLERDKKTYLDEIGPWQPFEDPKSTTGRLAQSAIQFLAGFAGAGKVTKGLEGAKLAAKLPRVFRTTKSLLDGALASAAVFDGHEERLSNFVESNPQLSNPVTRFLMAREEDGELEGKMKTALEDAGLGVLADGLITGLKAVRKARLAKAALEETPLPRAVAQAEEKTALREAADVKKDFEKLGNLQDARLVIPADPLAGVLPEREAQKIIRDWNMTQEEARQIRRGYEEVKAYPLKGTRTGKDDILATLRPDELTEYIINRGAAIKDAQGNIVVRGKELAEATGTKENFGFSKMIFKHGVTAQEAQKVPEVIRNYTPMEGPYGNIQWRVRLDTKHNMIVSFAQKEPNRYKEITVFKERRSKTKSYQMSQKKDISVPKEPFDSPSLDTNPGGGKPLTANLSSEMSSHSIGEKAAFVNPLEGKTYINFARIDTSEDVKKLMQEMADREKPAVDAARRGKQRFEEIKLNAEQQDAWDVLASRRTGQSLNAEQSVAARRLWAASGEKLAEVAALAAKEPTEANLFMFRKMAGIHAMVQKEIIAARTETARALASWRIPAGGGQMLEKEIQDALNATGGNETARELARRVAVLAQSGNLRAVEAVVEKGAKATTFDAVQEAFISGLLTNPPTHIVNVASNSLVQVWNILDRALAERISAWLGGDAGVAAGEAAAKMRGMVDGFTDGLRLAWKNFKTGESAFGADKLVVRKNAVSAETWNMAQGSLFGRAADMAGHAVQVPFRLLSGADEFFKAVAWRGEIKAQALRQAQAEAADGIIAKEAVERRIAELADNPPEHIKLAAAGEAEYATFTNAPNEFAKNISALARKVPGIKFFVPFIKTPSNVFDYAFAHSPFAPLTRRFRADMAAGGARQSMALAKVATGSLVMAAVADMTAKGLISGGGPDNPAERKALMAAGWQPYSVRIGDKWHAYRRLDPMGTIVGFGADLAEIIQAVQDEEEDKDLTDLVKMGVLSVANNILSTNFLMGFANLVEALSDPQRYGNSYIDRLALSFVPAGVKAVRRLQDPYMREAGTMLQKFKNTLPGLSESLPLRRDLFGREISYASGYGKIYDALVPVRVNGKEAEPVDEEILKQQVFVQMPAYKVSFDGETVNLRKRPEVYSRYVELAGNALPLPQYDGLGCKDFLNGVISGQSALSDIYQLYTDGPTGGKADFLRKTVHAYRAAAREKIKEEFPDIAEELRLREASKAGKIKI